MKKLFSLLILISLLFSSCTAPKTSSDSLSVVSVSFPGYSLAKEILGDNTFVYDLEDIYLHILVLLILNHLLEDYQILTYILYIVVLLQINLLILRLLLLDFGLNYQLFLI